MVSEANQCRNERTGSSGAVLLRRVVLTMIASLPAGCAGPIRDGVHGFEEATKCQFLRIEEERLCLQRIAGSGS